MAGVVWNSDTSSFYKYWREDPIWEHALNVTQKNNSWWYNFTLLSMHYYFFFFLLFLQLLWLLGFQPHMNFKLWILFNIITPLYAFIPLHLFFPTANYKFCLVFWAPSGSEDSCMPCAHLCSPPNQTERGNGTSRNPHVVSTNNESR